jgi:deoxyribodipyrimidine photo-lyase
MPDCQLYWLRRDLRLADNPALHAAARGEQLLCAYIHSPEEEADGAPGGASQWWLHHSLQQLDEALRERGNRLLITRGLTLPTLQQLCKQHSVSTVHWNRCYEPAQIARDTAIKRVLHDTGIDAQSHRGNLLHEPWEIEREGRDGGPYKVFSAYWRKASPQIDQPLHATPSTLPSAPESVDSLPLEALELLDGRQWNDWLARRWTPGEAAALDALSDFLGGPISGYDKARDLPAVTGTSRLSPHLHFGEISPRQIVRAALQLPDTKDHQRFLAEVGWREFAHHLLYHFPQTISEPLDQRFSDFRWENDAAALRAWQRGQTGIPLVDAGMRELWRTGWMHNRVRMVVASYLCKHLLIHWREGASWFMHTLLDADLANNTLGWQWTAGCGADAAPYFRVFNPATQAKKFDPEGKYLRRWLPELARLPDKYLYEPWSASAEVLRAAGVRLGENYPEPLMPLKEGRERALARFEEIKR